MLIQEGNPALKLDDSCLTVLLEMAQKDAPAYASGSMAREFASHFTLLDQTNALSKAKSNVLLAFVTGQNVPNPTNNRKVQDCLALVLSHDDPELIVDMR
eukprot:11567747-Ditylum_brightwellii.AAC.1